MQAKIKQGLVTQEQVVQKYWNLLLSREQQETIKQELGAGKKLVAMSVSNSQRAQQELKLVAARLQTNPRDHQAIRDYMNIALVASIEADRTGNTPKSQLIQQYLNYYLAVRNFDHPFDLVDLHKMVSPEDLLQYFEAHSSELSPREHDFLFAELIRRLKLNEPYSYHPWPEGTENILSKENIFDTLNPFRQKVTDECSFHGRDLNTIYLHLLGEEEITNFPPISWKVFYWIAFPLFWDGGYMPYNCDLRWANISVLNAKYEPRCWFFTNVDLRHANLASLYGTFRFENVSLVDANLEQIKTNTVRLIDRSVGHIFHYHGSSFQSVDFTRANLSDAHFDNTKFIDCNFIDANLTNTVFADNVTFKKCSVTESQYEQYFRKWSPWSFIIKREPIHRSKNKGLFSTVVQAAKKMFTNSHPFDVSL